MALEVLDAFKTLQSGDGEGPSRCADAPSSSVSCCGQDTRPSADRFTRAVTRAASAPTMRTCTLGQKRAAQAQSSAGPVGQEERRDGTTDVGEQSRPFRSHAMTDLLRLRSKDAHAADDPVSLARRFTFLNHCLCCNVLCKDCVLGDDKRAAALEELERQELGGDKLEGRFGYPSPPPGRRYVDFLNGSAP